MTTRPWGDDLRAGIRRRSMRRSLGRALAADRSTDRELIWSSSLWIIALVATWLVLQMLVLSNIEFNRDQDRLYAEFRSQLATQEAPVGGVIAPGRPVALVSFPALARDLIVVEGTAPGHLLSAPGHRRDTVLPGQAGVSVVYGRSRSYGHPFGFLKEQGLGRRIVVTTAQGRSEYRVTKIRRAGDPLPAPPASGQGRLTFVTSEGSGSLGYLRPGELMYVDAYLESKAYDGGGGRVNTVAASETPMANDPTVLPLLALGLGALLLIVVATPFSVRRFGGVATWIVMTPTTLALSWFLGGLVVYLLPNLM